MKVEIAKIISNGMGISWAEGKTFFVPFTLQGETIEIKSCIKNKNHFLADDFLLIKESPHRRKPLCPYYKKCGGCSIQHISYPKQAGLKKDILTELFHQNKVKSFPEPVFFSAGETGIRTRSKIFVKNGCLHYRAYKSHNLVEFKNCPLLNPFFHEEINQFSSKVSGDVQFEYSAVTGDFMPKQDSMTKVVNNREIHLSAGGFFQSSEEGAGILVSLLKETLENSKYDSAYDLFCGCGLFSIFMTEMGIKCTGIELTDESSFSFKKNLGNDAQFIKSDIYKLKSFQKKDIIVADPPRAGLGKHLIQAIADSGNSMLIYISCEPSVFARDTLLLFEKGYSLSRISIVDLFPDTHHFEIFSVFNRTEI